MNLTIHRGTHEIGGSCVELESGGSRILLDMGMPLVGRDGAPYDEKSHQGVDGPGLVERGVLPNVRGLYPWDESDARIDGLFISHAHPDHYGLASHGRDDVPIHLSSGTRLLMELTKTFTGRVMPTGNLQTFKAGQRIVCGSFTVIPYLMDHSAYDAMAFLIEAEGKRVFYSGDFRDHGRKGAKTMAYIEKNVAPEVDALLMEGTMFGREGEKPMTESELEDETVELIRACPKAVFVYPSGQNIDRLVSFYRAAKRTGRLFVADLYIANVLSELAKSEHGKHLPHPGPGFENFRVFYPFKSTRLYINEGKSSLAYPSKKYKIKREEIAAAPGEVVMTVRPSMYTDMGRLGDLQDSLLIYSMWQGYLTQDKTKNFIASLKSRGVKVKHWHTSGHASIRTLDELVQTLQPKRLIPIHTFYPEAFARFGDIVERVSDRDVVAL